MNNTARIVTINVIEPHLNADTLQIVKLLGTQVITSKDTQIGDLMIYFDSNLKLSKSYLHNNNLYRAAELNKDTSVTGYFEENGRVKAIKLRGEFSDGVLMPLHSLDYLSKSNDKNVLVHGYEFDIYNGERICEKYIPNIPIAKNSSKKSNKSKGRTKSIISPMFVEHVDTNHYFRNLHHIPANTVCHIIEKTHGTSGRIGNMLVDTTEKKNWITRFLHKLMRRRIYEYNYIHGSRRVVLNEPSKKYKPYHDPSMREQILNSVKGLIHKNVELYFEIYGYEPSGAYIQQGFSYGCKPKEYKVKLYRMTMNNPDGHVLDYSLSYVVDKAKEFGFEAPYIFESYFYDGTPESLEILNQKVIDYAQGNSIMDTNTMREGVIVQFINSKGNWECLKYKSDAFRAFESKAKDVGIIDPEDVN